MRKLGTAILFVVAASVVAVSSAVAATSSRTLLGSSCGASLSQPFAPWGDTNGYYLAPNGGLESGSNGWSLSGASIVAGNEPFYRNGSHSLSLPSGSSAVSPQVCIGLDSPVLRMFVEDSSGTDAGLRVRVYWYGLLNTLLGITDYATFAPGTAWAPSNKVPTIGGIDLLVPVLGSTSARVVLTPLGSGSAWNVDDLYIDPLASRCC